MGRCVLGHLLCCGRLEAIDEYARLSQAQLGFQEGVVESFVASTCAVEEAKEVPGVITIWSNRNVHEIKKSLNSQLSKTFLLTAYSAG